MNTSATSILCALVWQRTRAMHSRTTTADEHSEAEAKAHYKQGKAYLDAKLYDKALAEFASAYGFAPLPELLFDEAQAYRLSGSLESALTAYKTFLRRVPMAPLRTRREPISPRSRRTSRRRGIAKTANRPLPNQQHRDEQAHEAEQQQQEAANAQQRDDKAVRDWETKKSHEKFGVLVLVLGAAGTAGAFYEFASACDPMGGQIPQLISRKTSTTRQWSQA